MGQEAISNLNKGNTLLISLPVHGFKDCMELLFFWAIYKLPAALVTLSTADDTLVKARLCLRIYQYREDQWSKHIGCACHQSCSR